MSVTVRTQAELDQALADQVDTIYIESTNGVTLIIGDGGRADVRNGGWADVRNGGWADVSDGGWAYVRNGGWADVRNGGRAYVRNGGRAYVSDGGRAYVSDGGRADVSDGGRADVSGPSTAHLHAGATAKAAPPSVLFVHSRRATFDGGHIVDLTAIDLNDPLQWCEYHGVEIVDGIAYLFKAVDDEWRSTHGGVYTPGSTPKADDWNAVAHCGNGLFFCDRPGKSLTYMAGATKFVKVGVRVAELVVVDGDKVKAPEVVVPCVEVDLFGAVVEAVSV